MRGVQPHLATIQFLAAFTSRDSHGLWADKGSWNYESCSVEASGLAARQLDTKTYTQKCFPKACWPDTSMIWNSCFSKMVLSRTPQPKQAFSKNSPKPSTTPSREPQRSRQIGCQWAVGDWSACHLSADEFGTSGIQG